MKRILSLIALMVWTACLFAQDLQVKGKIVSKTDGQPIPGVSVSVKGTTTGTITNIDGEYTLTAPQGATLVYSFIGMKTQEVVATSGTMDVAMSDEVSDLNEVVVVGYGVQKKSVTTGAIASIKSDEITSTPVSSSAQALQGKAAGVMITSNSGAPGAGVNISVRGVGTNGDNTPLFIVDGLQCGNIDFLAPEDIESMEVLKDAASAAIYGSRGANGVVLVTTKKGKEGKMTVNYDGYYGVQSAWRKASVLDAQEYMMLHNEGYLNDGATPVYGDADFAKYGKGTDWQDEMFNNSAPITSHNAQIMGGSGASTFLFSLGYFGQEGIVGGDKSKYDRITSRLNSEHKLSDMFKFGQNLSLVNTKSHGVGENNDHGSLFQIATIHDPLTPVYETDPVKIAQYGGMPILPVQDSQGRFYGISDQNLNEIVNPLARIETTWGESITNQAMGNMYLEFTPLKGLRFKTDFGIDAGYSTSRGYGEPAYYNSKNITLVSSASQSTTNWTNWQWENIANYNIKLNEVHNLDFLAGMTSRRDEGRSVSGGRTNLSIPGWDYAWLNNGSQEDQTSGGYTWEHTMLSYFGRVNYNFSEKYLVSGVVRYDGSSRFGSDNRFGLFPSAQVGWVASQEEFLQDNSIISFLKVRLAYGQTGNENIGDFGYLEAIGGTADYMMGSDVAGTPVAGKAITRMSNPSLKWEAAEEFNFGIDASFLDNRIYTNIDLYNRVRKDLLSDQPVALYTGLNSPTANLGTVSNKGVEFMIKYNGEANKLKYDISANFAYNKNEVTEVLNQNGYINGGGAFGYNGNLRMEEGFALPYFYGYKTNGILQNQAEADAYNASTNKAANGDLGTAKPGDIRFVDINGDGSISDADRTEIGNPHPDMTFGLTANASYQGFDFSMFFQGQTGNDIVNTTMRTDKMYGQNYLSRYLDRWTGEGSTNDFPRFTHVDGNENYKRINDMVHIEDGSYVRLKNITLGYTLPKSIVSKIKINKARFYISGQNMWTWTKYTGFDPEIGWGGAWVGFDRGAYPMSRTILLGTNITF